MGRDDDRLRYDAWVSGTRDADVLFMHLHREGRGEVGPVSVMLSDLGEARASGTVRLTALQRVALEAGSLYFDVHTRAHPRGTVRAQVIGPDHNSEEK